MSYYLYWLHAKHHTDPQSEGYVGVTKQKHKYRGRIASHFRKLKNGSHTNPILINAYRKHNGLETTILCEGTEEYCVGLEHSFRSERNIGWNIMEGGNIPPSQTGKHWYTNGEKNTLAFECPEGFRNGKTQVSGEHHGHHGKPKNYECKGVFEKGHTPWNKGLSYKRKKK